MPTSLTLWSSSSEQTVIFDVGSDLCCFHLLARESPKEGNTSHVEQYWSCKKNSVRTDALALSKKPDPLTLAKQKCEKWELAADLETAHKHGWFRIFFLQR